MVAIADVARRCFPTSTSTRRGRATCASAARSTLDLGAPDGAVLGPDGEFLALYEQRGRCRSRSPSSPRARLKRRGRRPVAVFTGLDSDRLSRVRIWRSLDEVPADLGRTVVTIGNFDGVHLGHQHVVARAREVAATAAGSPWSR